MLTVNLKQLVGKLNDVCRRSLEAAAGFCLSQTHYNVEIEHWLVKLIDVPDSDLLWLFRFYEVDVSRLKSDLTRCLDRMKTGNSRSPGLAPVTVDLMRGAWLLASVDFGGVKVRSSHLLMALLADDAMARLAGEISTEFDKISVESLRKEAPGLLAQSVESDHRGTDSINEGKRAGSDAKRGGPSRTPSLDQFTIDLTARAKAGRIDPVLGRDAEVRQIIDILMRRRQNNPILTGEAGVGKTAVVEGFAQRVADEDVPPSLRGVAVRTLDLSLLQAGAGVKGDFENRLRSVIDEVKASEQPIILFIDEAHTLIGAGGQAGQGDAANLLKPALARGELRTIAATTWAEYKKYFEKDAALARRFQVVKVEEPTEGVAVQMMRGLVSTLETHHQVRILEESVVDAVRLSHRYISGRQLPDKSVSLLDTACARVAISQSAVPPALEDCMRRITQHEVSIGILQREQALGADHRDKIAELEEARAQAQSEQATLQAQWEKEKELVGQIRQLRDRLERQPGKDQSLPVLSREEKQTLLSQLAKLEADLKQAQGEKPLLQVCVDSQAVAEVVSAWTGIPVGRMVTDEIRGILNLQERLEKRIIGQSHALDAVAQSIRTSRAKMADPRKPIGIFLFVGTSGVGKTETAIALAELMYGSEQAMTVINMSEFKEEHKVSLLMGSPPGYVGYGEGGVMTEAVRRKPYSVLLLDEMEKAHPGVQDIFYQVFDKGHMKDGEGRDIDFKNTVIIMTSNAATDLITSLCADPTTMPDAAALQEAIYPELTKTFKPAFLGRVSIIPYFPLGDDVMRQIVELKLQRIAKRIRENYRAKFTHSPAFVDGITARCKEVSTGARNADLLLTRTLLPEISAEFLSRMADGKTISSVHVDVASDSRFIYDIQ